MAADALQRAVPYSAANGYTGLPPGLQILGDKYNEESFGPDNRWPRSHTIPAVEQRLLPERSCCADHAVVPSSSQRMRLEGAALVCLWLGNGATMSSSIRLVHAHCHDLSLSTTLAPV